MSQLYSNVSKSNSDAPATPPRKPRPSQRRAVAARPEPAPPGTPDDDPEAPEVPSKNEELIKECALLNGADHEDLSNGNGNPKPKERPVPKKRNLTPKKIEVPSQSVSQPISSPGINNPFYEETIPIKRPSAKTKPLPEVPVEDSPSKKKSKNKAPKSSKKKSPKKIFQVQEEGTAVYELATALPVTDGGDRISEAHSDIEELDPTYITSAEGSKLTQAQYDPSFGAKSGPTPVDVGGARPKIPKTEDNIAVGSIIVDKYFYNFICTFKGRDLEAIQKTGTMKTKAALEGSPREIELKFQANEPSEIRKMESRFIDVYQRLQQGLKVLSVNVTHVKDVSELENELMNKFESLCFHVSDKQIDIVLEDKNISVIRRCITKHGGLAAHVPGSIRRKKPNRAETIDSDDPVFTENNNADMKSSSGANAAPTPKPRDQSTIQYPVGYDIGGQFHVYVYKTDITTLHVDAIVNAANGRLHHGGGVAKAIQAAAGPALEKDGKEILRKQKEIPVSEVVKTTAGKMPSRMVFHAVGPKWPSKLDTNQQEECLRMLKQTFDNVLSFARKEGIKTLAIPPISSGIYRVPVDHVAKAIFDSLVDAASPADGSKSKLREVHIVDIGDDVLDLLVPMFGGSRLIKDQHGRAIALTEMAREDIKISSPDHRFKQMIDESLTAKSPLKRQKSGFFGRLCGSRRNQHKYN